MNKIAYLSEENKVAMIQKFHTDKGSLRDVLFEERPYRDKKRLHVRHNCAGHP